MSRFFSLWAIGKEWATENGISTKTKQDRDMSIARSFNSTRTPNKKDTNKGMILERQ
jgi:hypothetical protein